MNRRDSDKEGGQEIIIIIIITIINRFV